MFQKQEEINEMELSDVVRGHTLNGILDKAMQNPRKKVYEDKARLLKSAEALMDILN
jgi:hypothetical protein